MAIKRLTVAYRSRSRPSSTLGAKASTMCPYYLDGDQVLRRLERFLAPCGTQGEAPSPARENPVIPVFSRRLSMAADVASVQFSRTVERRFRRLVGLNSGAARFGLALIPTGGRRSLKTQQHAGVCLCRGPRRPTVGRVAMAEIGPVGSVDMLGPIRLVTARPQGPAAAGSGRPLGRSLERR